jgi:hypothetical protein
MQKNSKFHKLYMGPRPNFELKKRTPSRLFSERLGLATHAILVNFENETTR